MRHSFRTCVAHFDARRAARNASRRRLHMEVLGAALRDDGDLVISEFMADNDGVLLDNYGVESDWIEIHNTTARTDQFQWLLSDG